MSDPTGAAPPSARSRRLAELAGLFLVLGTIGVGGPAAHIALMEDAVVTRRRWLTRPEFLDLLGAVQLIPGPNSTELALHIGLRRAGWAGLLVAGACFILPAALLVTGLAWAYARAGALPAVAGLLQGAAPVVAAIILVAAWRLRSLVTDTLRLALVMVAAIGARLAGVPDPAILLGAAAAAVLLSRRTGVPRPPTMAVEPLTLTAVFLKVGSLLFGSGYVVVALLRTELVEQRGWLTAGQLTDAITVGQVTPGPVLTTATFIGYLLDGGRGAVLATLGIFLPAFVLVACSGPLLPRLRRSPWAAAALDGVNAASLGLLVLVGGQMAVGAVRGPWSGGIGVIALAALLTGRASSTWVLLLGALAGALLLR